MKTLESVIKVFPKVLIRKFVIIVLFVILFSIIVWILVFTILITLCVIILKSVSMFKVLFVVLIDRSLLMCVIDIIRLRFLSPFILRLLLWWLIFKLKVVIRIIVVTFVIRIPWLRVISITILITCWMVINIIWFIRLFEDILFLNPYRGSLYLLG